MCKSLIPVYTLLLVVDEGKPGSSRTSLFSLNIFAGNQCPGRPDSGCCVPRPPNFSRAFYPPPEEFDGKAERQ